MRIATIFLALAITATALAAKPASGGVLLVYDFATKPFSMENEIEPIAILLSRYTTDIQRRTAKEVTLADLEKAERIVVAGIGGFPALSPGCLEYLQKTTKPIVCIGAAAVLANGGSPDRGGKSEALAKGQLVYLGTEWSASVDPYYPVQVDATKVLARIGSPGKQLPLCWRSGNRIGFAALPSSPPLSMVFSDVLLDVFGSENAAPPSLLFIVRDFNPSCSAESLRRLADYFAHHGIPFAVTTQMRDLPEGTEPMPREEFLAALEYASSHGGRIFLRGGEGFKDAAKFDPIKPCGIEEPDQPDTTALQIGRPTYARIPEEPKSPFFIHAPMRLPGGGWMWPANVRGGMDGTLLDDIRKQVRDIVAFRGSVAGVVIPAWMPFQSMRDVVDAARSSGVTAIDPVAAVPEPKPTFQP